MCHGRAVPLQILEDNTSRQHVPVREGCSLESVLGNWSLEIAIVSLLSVVLLGEVRPCTDHITVQVVTRDVIPCTDHITVQVVTRDVIPCTDHILYRPYHCTGGVSPCTDHITSVYCIDKNAQRIELN